MMPCSTALLFLALAAGADLKVKPTDWPQFRGPNRDGASGETGLLKVWPTEGPNKLWTVSGLGGGYGSTSVIGGVIFGTGRKNGEEHIWAIEEATGKPKWSTAFASKVDKEDGPRSTPTYAAGKVYAVGPLGDLVCADATTGKILWQKNYVKDFGGSVHVWGYCDSVLVDGNSVIATPCSKTAAVVALDANTGATIWKTTVPNAGDAGGYASAVKAEIGGTKMYVTLLGQAGGVVGVDAKTGKLLWQYTKMMNGTANVPSPIVHGDKVFCSTGYEAGAALLKIVPKGAGAFEAQEIKFYKGSELQNHHGGMVRVGDYVYLGSQHNKGNPACVDLRTGAIQWKEDANVGKGDGSAAVAAADGMLYFRYQNHVMALIKADPKEFTLVSSFKLPEWSRKNSWQHPAIANGRLYIRDQDKLHAFDIKATKE